MRKAYIDLLRIICITLVMFNHTGTAGYMLFTERTESPFYFVYLSFSICCKIAVPVFFMISGALLLKKQENIIDVIKKRLLRIVVALLIASVVYYILFNKDEISIVSFLKTIYSSSATTSLWYLYSYCGMLLMLPLLQKLAQAMANSDFVYLICAYVILTGVIPAMEDILFQGDLTLNPHFSVVLYTTSNVVYVLTGYFLENRLREDYFSNKNVLKLSVVSIVSIGLTCVLTQFKINEMGFSSLELVESYFNHFILVPSLSVFFIVKGAFVKINLSQRVSKIITTLGASVFGAYLIEKLVRVLFRPVYVFLNPYIGSFLATIMWVFFGTSVSLLFITALRKCPYINKAINWLI